MTFLTIGDERKFKIAFLDVGLMQNALGVQDSIILDDSVMKINAGSIAEQFVAQELLACADPYADQKLHFWAREARGSNAEVDFLVEFEGMPIPIEVKAGARGSLKSMRLFLKEYPKTLLGIRYSMHEFGVASSFPIQCSMLTARLWWIGHSIFDQLLPGKCSCCDFHNFFVGHRFKFLFNLS